MGDFLAQIPHVIKQFNKNYSSEQIFLWQLKTFGFLQHGCRIPVYHKMFTLLTVFKTFMRKFQWQLLLRAAVKEMEARKHLFQFQEKDIIFLKN